MFLRLLQNLCGIIHKLHDILPDFVLRKINLVLFYPHLTYAVAVWGGGCKPYRPAGLQSLQNKCL